MKKTLLDIASDHHSLDEGLTIYAVKPWSSSSIAVVAREQDDGGVPEEASQIGAVYFLEVSTAIEFLVGWRASLGRSVSTAEQCERLIQYATNDA